MVVSLTSTPSWAEKEPEAATAQTAASPPAKSQGQPFVDETVEAAKKKARETGKRVEIPKRNSETTTLYANPDGRTLRMELSIEPVRVKKADGTLIPIDTTLVEDHGVVRPKAAKGTLRLSAGGDTTLLTSKAGAATTKLTASRNLPRPKLKRNTATYPSAYGKGADLVVIATTTGFRQQIVLRERPSGPVTFRVPVDLPEGISFGKDASGQPVVLGADGKKISDIRPAPLLDANVTSDDGDFEAGKVGRAAVSVDEAASTLVYTPDTAFLADPAVVYPVTLAAVEPDWWEPEENETVDTFVNDVDYTDSDVAQYLDRILVGKSFADGIAKRWRSYLRFQDIPADSPLNGATVENADLVLWNHLSHDCGDPVGSGVTVRRITSNWSSDTLTWGNQPSTTSTGAYTGYGAYSPDCTSQQWADKEWDLVYSIEDIVQEWAFGTPNYGIRLTSGNESDVRNWRRYRTTEYEMCFDGRDCEGHPHQPLLFVDFEPAPKVLTYFSHTGPPLTAPPTYEEAVALHTDPVEGDVPSRPGVTEEQALAYENEITTPYEIGPDKLQPLAGEDWSGSEVDDENGEFIVGDDTAPTVVDVSPARGATDVPLTTEIRTVFSERVWDPELTVKDPAGNSVAGTANLDSTEKILTFTPANPLTAATRYTVAVTNAGDEEANTMAPVTWSFTTVSQAHWKFDEGDGRTAADSSGGDHNASLTDTAAWIPGKSGTAISNTPAQAQMAAARKAVQQGKAVEVAETTTETSITHAQPDGTTFTTQIAASPVRTKQGGAWVPIDTTLVEQGGVLRPKASASGVHVGVSIGGTDAFVKMVSADGRTYALRWPAPLPKPAVSRNVATFADAAGPGADLVVTVLPTGFRHDVVLRQRPAKPLEIRIGVETGGLTLAEGKGGRLLLTGKGDKLVASAPQPVMVEAAAKGRLAQAKREKINTEVITKGGRTELVLRPDHKFLSDAARKFPVRVDPTITLPFNHDVDVHPGNDADWPADPTYPFLLAGTFGGGPSRVHLRFDTTGLSGANVTEAKLALTNIDAQDCGPTVGAGIQVRRLTGAWDENNLHWGNKPGSTTEDAQTNRAAYGQACDSGAAAMEWTITGIAQDWAAGAANHGLVLQHPNETDTADNYRLFTSSEDDLGYGPAPTLTVTTTGPASAPTVTDPAITPAQTVDGTTVVGSLTPQLAATVTDTAGGNLTGEFEIEHDPAAPGGRAPARSGPAPRHRSSPAPRRASPSRPQNWPTGGKFAGGHGRPTRARPLPRPGQPGRAPRSTSPTRWSTSFR